MGFEVPWYEDAIVRCNCQMARLRNQARCDDVLRYMQRLCEDPSYPPPDRVSYNIVIDTLGKASRLELMEQTFCMMIKTGFLPDVRTFTSILHAYVRERHGIGVLSTLHAMDELGIKPNEITNTVLEMWLFGSISRPSVFLGS